MNAFLKDKRNVLITLFLGLLAYGWIGGGESWWIVGGAGLGAAFDFLAALVFKKKAIIPKSGLISGFIIAGVIFEQVGWLWLAGLCLLAILSKHLIKFKGSHIFNPAGLALFCATWLGQPLTWHIEDNIYLIVLFGLYLVWTLRKLPHVLGFLIVFSLLILTQGFNPLLVISWFFVFVMLIEPKTSAVLGWKGAVFGAVAAVGAFTAYMFFGGRDIFVTGLFLANLSRPLLTRR